MYQSRQRPDDISTGCIMAAVMFGLIATPFIKCGQAIGCVSEDFGAAKVLVNEHGDECREASHPKCELASYRPKGEHQEDRK